MRRDHRVDDLLPQRAHLGVGQRAVGRAEAQRERQAPAAGAERVGAEHVERRTSSSSVTGRGAHRAHDVGGGDGVVDDEGEVDGRRREPRGRAERAVATGARRAACRARARPRPPVRRARARRAPSGATSPTVPASWPSTSDAGGATGAVPGERRRLEHDVVDRRARRAPRSRRRARRTRRPRGRPRPGGDGSRRPTPAATCSGSSGSGSSPARRRSSGVRNTRPISNSATSVSPCARLPATARSRPGQHRGAQHRLLGAQRVGRRARSGRAARRRARGRRARPARG